MRKIDFLGMNGPGVSQIYLKQTFSDSVIIE